jgi:hypothetical protein
MYLTSMKVNYYVCCLMTKLLKEIFCVEWIMGNFVTQFSLYDNLRVVTTTQVN